MTQSSNSEHLSELYRQHHAMVFQICLGYVNGDYDTASDLSQEIFISVWRNLSKFKGASTYKTWIYRITVNCCLQYVKKAKKELRFVSRESEAEIESRSIELNEKQGMSELYNAIAQLKKLDRLIIMMVLEDQDSTSISEILGIEQVNVRVKIHRIKKRLKAILKNNKNEQGI